MMIDSVRLVTAQTKRIDLRVVKSGTESRTEFSRMRVLNHIMFVPSNSLLLRQRIQTRRRRGSGNIIQIRISTKTTNQSPINERNELNQDNI
jgi:hypothetical protein